ncbi:lipocalin family protein [Paenalcaligenes niemegkensis]|uniref:lipocalin family protein n=1 Tax=Paenalcaligenes niemegkensis TaxID=2895469 RepID=UPI001EE8176F|nr:lipocalin family protein [Paenalcaligenes niemegkensis]MCQ9616669.1 lipocalin family protein [Paenalcaligenes niemegkensis]
MKLLRFTPLLVTGAFLLSLSLGTHAADLPTQAGVDLNKYAGEWHEVARLPLKYEDECTADVRATYVLNEDGSLKVLNQCQIADGSINSAEGEGRLAAVGEGSDPSKLEVRFAPGWLSWLPMVWGDYWILKVEGDYEYSLVGSPDLEYLWLLSRTTSPDEAVVNDLLNYAQELGFSLEEIIRTPM